MTPKINKNLIKGSLVLLIAFGLFNFLNFLFQSIMARMLTIPEYAVLSALFAIIYILLILTEAVQTIVTKYSAEENDKGKLKNLLKRVSKKAFSTSTVLFFTYLLLTIPFSHLLKIDYTLLAINGLVIFLAFLLPITRGLMQGKKRFKSLGVNMVLESSAKLIFAILLVFIGWKVYGALIGVILGGAIALAFSLSPLKDIIKSKEVKADTKGIYNYAKPTFVITAIIVVFYSLDILIAKIFFPIELVGSYAIASILGKIIFWGTLPISKAMFPMSSSSERGPPNKKSQNVFANSLTIVLIGIALALAVFYLAPGLIIKAFSGKFIPEAISILFYVGIAFSFISLANLVLLYKLSQGKTKGHVYLFILIPLEIFLLSIFSKDLYQFSLAFIVASAMFLWASIILMNE